MDFELPSAVRAKLAELDAFIEAQIRPLERDTMTAWELDRRDPIRYRITEGWEEIKIRRGMQYLFGFGHKGAE